MSACKRQAPESDDGAVVTPDTQLPPVPLTRFEPATEAQEALLRDAQNSELGSADVSVTALIELCRSGPRSDARGLGCLLLADAYQAGGRAEDAVAVLDELSTWAPRSANLEFVRATALIDAGREAEAADALSRAVRIDPDHVRAYPLLAALRESLSQPRAAEGALLAMERAILRLHDELESGASTERQHEVLALLRAGYPNAAATRATLVALTSGDEAVVNDALSTLEQIGTADALPALDALGAEDTPSARRAAAVAATIRANQAPTP